MKELVLLALDPGVTTGWAILNKELAVLGMGDLSPEELGCGLDLLIRAMHRLGMSVVPIVEDVPLAKGTKSALSRTLEFVNRTIDHWVVDVFELPVVYVPPSRWKTSRSTLKRPAVKEWNGHKTSQHMRDAYMMACYHAQTSGVLS